MPRHDESNGEDRISDPAEGRSVFSRAFRTYPGPPMRTFRPSMVSWAAPIVLGMLALCGSPTASTFDDVIASVSEASRSESSLAPERTHGRSRVQASPPRPFGVLLDGNGPQRLGSYETRTSNQGDRTGADPDIGPPQARLAFAVPSYFALRAAIARGGFLSSPSRAPPPSLR